MEHFTIHIFGYGETQINGDEFSVKVSTDSLTTVKPLVDAVWADKPADVNSEQDFHVINIFNYNEIRYIANEDFTLEVNPALKALIDNLITELKNALNALPPVVQPNVATPPVVQENVVTPPVVQPTVATPPVVQENVVTPPVVQENVVTPPVVQENVVTPPVVQENVVTPPPPNMDEPTLII